jgi:NADH-ubiquinone oxidoreductase chain 5
MSVTAGVYLLIRFSVAFGEHLNIILLLISGLTVLITGPGANFEYDLKKKLSTMKRVILFSRYNFMEFCSGS